MTRLGILSFAHLHAHGYAASINSLPDATLAAIWDDNAARGKAAATQYGAPFVASLEDFFAKCDGVIICSENMRHREHAEAAAAAGRWILCEKPLAPTVADAKAIVKACEKAKVGLGVAFPCRFSVPLIAAREQIQSGALGEIYAISATNNGAFPGGWFADETLSGGGAVMDHTVHVADALRWMLDREFTEVYCDAGNQVHPDKIACEDLGILQLKMEGGIQVSHIASWIRPAAFPTWGDVTLEIVGEGGVLWVDAFNQKLQVFSEAAGKGQWAGYGDDPNRAMIADFVAAMQEQRPPRATGLDGVRATEVTQAAYKSWRGNRVTKL